MHIFYSEYQNDYSTYTFSYCPYCVCETVDEIPVIYASGFLPYSGNPKLHQYVYYMARSLRISLQEFYFTSENRRVDRKFERCKIEKKWIPITAFDIEDRRFLDFCLNYCNARFSQGEMNESRLRYVLKSPFLTDIICYYIDEVVAGYVFVSMHGGVIHYWYSFYNLEKFIEIPLGKFLMMDVIRESKKRRMEYIYLGTCYGAESLYKVRDFKGVKFFDGERWRSDIHTLKSWCKADEEIKHADRFKQLSTEQVNQNFDKRGWC